MTIHEYAWADNFEAAVAMLPDHLYAGFDLDITTEERGVLESLVARSSAGARFQIDELDSCESFFQHIGNNEAISSSTCKIITKLADSYNVTNGLRLVTGIQNYPDWHFDPSGNDKDILYYHIVITLKGPGTLFCNLSDDISAQNRLFDKKYNSLPIDASKYDGRPDHIDLCSSQDGHSIKQAETLSGIVFSMGGAMELATLHSTPYHSSEERIFLDLNWKTKKI